jgi:hypothetical protein
LAAITDPGAAAFCVGRIDNRLVADERVRPLRDLHTCLRGTAILGLLRNRKATSCAVISDVYCCVQRFTEEKCGPDGLMNIQYVNRLKVFFETDAVFS